MRWERHIERSPLLVTAFDDCYDQQKEHGSIQLLSGFCFSAWSSRRLVSISEHWQDQDDMHFWLKARALGVNTLGKGRKGCDLKRLV